MMARVGLNGLGRIGRCTLKMLLDPHASIVDLNETQVTGGNLVKMMSWYDNEWGYSAQMVRYATAALRQPIEAK